MISIHFPKSCAFLLFSLVILLNLAVSAIQECPEDDLAAAFTEPPLDCRPHTRWWWMGNAVTRESITFQLEEIQKQGIGGMEQITMGPVYEKGNCD